MRKKLTVMLLVGVMCLSAVTIALAYNEAPELRVKVAAGELPPVEERLPEEPLVIGSGSYVLEENLDFKVGEYGGTLRTASWNPGWIDIVFFNGLEPLVSVLGIGTESQKTKGNVLKDYTISEDGKVFTFYMRKGMKWSDGVPVTSADVLFAWEDYQFYEELTQLTESLVWLRSGANPASELGKLEVIDDYTFKISFTEPYEGFAYQLAIRSWMSYQPLLKPKHYLKQFHPRYTSMEKLESLIKEEGLSQGEWWTLFKRKDFGRWSTPSPDILGFPVLSPWVLAEVTPQIQTYKRNPYYWKVDTAGNQLPYIDKVRSELVTNRQTFLMKVLTGEVDLEPEMIVLAELPLVKEQEEKAGYRVLLGMTFSTWPAAISFNYTHPDPVWREVIGDLRFRKALNMSIDFEEILDTLAYGLGEVPPAAVPQNLQAANQLLDEMGLDKRDEEGWRLGPDGEVFVIPFETGGMSGTYMSAMELCKEYFEAIGLKTTIKTYEAALFGDRYQGGNLTKATVLYLARPMWGGAWMDFTLYPITGQWERWYNSRGEEGEEPPSEVKRLYEIYQEMTVVKAGGQRYGELLDELYTLMDENLFQIPLVGEVQQIIIANKQLENLAYKGIATAAYYTQEQLFFRQ